MAKRQKSTQLLPAVSGGYGSLVADISELLDQARRSAARAVNSVLTATYWEVGRRIVEFEQGGKARAEYGEALIPRLAQDLSAKFGRGFSERNLWNMKDFYLGWEILQTPSAEFVARARSPAQLAEAVEPIGSTSPGTLPILPTLSAISASAGVFPLSWSHYVRLMSVEKPHARVFYESEAIRGGWSVRQLHRQIGTQFFERTAHSKQPEAMLARAQKPKPEDAVSVEEEVRDPYLLEFLNLKDEYSEAELEEALIQNLESFLLELGAGFAFVARQKRIRIGDEWYRMDLLLFHRRLRCLVVIDLKIGTFTPADAG
jgi:predicted nuclease of restriction endonuclease-like (RecB) superfamily